MEGEPNEVVLFGTWPSAFCTRIHLALKLKGIPYKYVEEDLSNKSELLLRYNPIHKKVPVLVHNGKPIIESLMILEYIEEYWNHSPKIFPEDPIERAKLRFWVNFHDQKIMQPGTYPIVVSKGEEREKAIEEFREALKVFEEGIKRDFGDQSPLFNGKTLGVLDIVVGTFGCTYEAFHEVVAVIISPKKNPNYFSWVNAMKDHPLVKETLPPHHKLVAKMKERFFQSLVV